jgi:hypothetical protein
MEYSSLKVTLYVDEITRDQQYGFQCTRATTDHIYMFPTFQ